MAASIGPCPHCGQQHADDVLLCPTTERLVPLEGRILDGKFRFVKLLGEGGMGAVWRAENMLVKKTVAIKLMHVQFSRDEGVLARFRNEATAAGRIGSKHICDILDLGRSQLGPYIVMEMLHGSDMADFIVKRQGKVDPGVTVMVVRQALIGLGAAHDVGIVHRDLKPENVFLHEPEPNRLLVKLMDFGISKFTQGENAGKTGMGVLMGTPEYMSPEQTEGAAQTDARTDIWAMGVILYWALAGRNPFVGQTMAATLMNVSMREPPPLHQAAPHVAPGLSEVVARCLRKNPEERWPNCQALSDALAPYENIAAAPWMPASGTAISAPGMSMAPPPPAMTPAAFGQTVASTGMPPMPMGAAPTPAPGATAFASQPPPGMAMRPPSDLATPPVAPSGPTFGTRGTPAATGPTWSGDIGAPPQSAPTIGGMGSSFDAIDDDRRPDRNIGGGKGLLIGVLVLLVGGGAAASWYAYNSSKTAKVETTTTETPPVVASADAGTPKADDGAKAAGDEAKAAGDEAKAAGDEAKAAGDEAKADDAGAAEGKAAEGGAAADGGKADGGVAEGGKADGGAADGGKADGGAADGGVADGGKADGGAADGGAADGGKADGGVADGGKTDDGGAAEGGGKADDGGTEPDPKPHPSAPKIDKSKVIEKGSLYITKVSVGARPNPAAAKALCAGLKFANVKGWKLPSAAQAKSITAKTWVDDGGNNVWNGSKTAMVPRSGGPQPTICVKKK